MSTVTEPVSVPYSPPWRARCATLAFTISFLLGMQAMFGQEPPIQRLSTTAVCRPDCAHKLPGCTAAKDENFKLL